MTHEEHSALLSVAAEIVVESLSEIVNVRRIFSHKRITELESHRAEVFIVEVSVRVVSEVLHSIDYASVFLTRDNLHRLHDNFLILYASERLEPILRFVEVTWSNVLTSHSAIDAYSRREREEYVIAWEFLLIFLYGEVESIISLLPCRAECNDEDSLVILLVSLNGSIYFTLVEFHVGDVVVVIIIIATSGECHGREESYCCHHQEFNLLHFLFGFYNVYC